MMQDTSLAIIANKQPVSRQTQARSANSGNEVGFLEAARQTALSRMVVAAGVDMDEMGFPRHRSFASTGEDETYGDTAYDMIAEIRRILRENADPLVKGSEK